MKNMKRWAAVILALGIAAGWVLFPFLGTAVAYEDRTAQATEVLTALGILQQGESTEGKVRRGKAAVYIARLMGFGFEQFEYPDPPFTDVSADSEYAAAAAMLFDMGIMSGFDDNTFRGDEEIQYDHAIKMIVSALGYDFYAQTMGDGPIGYAVAASQLRLTKGAEKSSGDDTIELETFLRLLYNATDVDIMQLVSFGDTKRYEVIRNRTILTERLNIYKDEGVVAATNVTSLSDPNARTGSGFVEINQERYKSESWAQNLIGCRVTYYYRDNSDLGEKTLLYATVHQNVRICEIDNDHIDSFEAGKYSFKQGQLSTATLSNNVDVIYNGKAITSFVGLQEQEIFHPGRQGNIVLVDNYNRGVFDTVIITVYENYVVNKVDVENGIIYSNKNNQRAVRLDPKDSRITYSIKNQEGDVLLLEQLEEGQIVSVAGSLDQKNYDMIVSEKTIQGNVDQLYAADQSRRIISIGGEEYQLDDYMATVSFTIGVNAEFALDYKGRIAGQKNQGNRGLLAYLIAIQPTTGVDGTVECKMLTADNAVKILNCAANVTINGTRVRIRDNMPEAEKLIQYFLDADGNIREINTEDGDALNLIFSDSPTTRRKFKSNAGIIQGKVVIAESTLVFKIPVHDKETKQDSDYRVIDLKDDVNYLGVRAYRTGDDKPEADAVVVAVSAEFTGGELKGVSIVDKVVSALDEEGQEIDKLYVRTIDGETEEFLSTAAGVLSQLRPGSCIRVTANEDGKIGEDISNYIDNVSVADSSLEQTWQGIYEGRFNKNSWDNAYNPISGSVYKLAGNIIYVAGGKAEDMGGEGDCMAYNMKDAKVCVVQYTAGGIKITAGEKADLVDYFHGGNSDYSRIVGVNDNGRLKSIVIYK